VYVSLFINRLLNCNMVSGVKLVYMDGRQHLYSDEEISENSMRMGYFSRQRYVNDYLEIINIPQRKN
jgi:hypothetical protein